MLSAITNSVELHDALAAPFTADDLEWKVQSCGERDGRPWALVVPYLSARAIQARLDEVVGPGGWRNRYEPIMKANEVSGYLCYLALHIDADWVEKCDGAELTDIEPVKGGLSNALKRCAVQWGLGRYLYALPTCWANIHEKGKERGKTKEGKWFNWDPPANLGISAPKPERPEGNGQAPRQQTAPAAAATTAAKPTTATPAASATTKPTLADLRGAKQRQDEAKELLSQGTSADVAKAKVTAIYGDLKALDDPLAVTLWRSTAGNWTEKLKAFEIITFGYQRAFEQWSEDEALDSIQYFKDEAGWPRDATVKATPEQVAKLVDFFSTIKPANAAAAKG